MRTKNNWRRLPGPTWVCLGALAVLLAGSGCSTFNYEWRREARKPAPAGDITGPWEGKWTSQSSGHHDRLRCLVTQTGEGHYAARFRATYKGWLHFTYTVPLEVKPGTNGVQFQGVADLGKLAGGVYHYDGHATASSYFSTYQAKYDRGTFEMSRPPAL